MTTLCDDTIRSLRLVTPFHERTEACGLTFGVGPCGYDVRIAETAILKPGDVALASTIEYFEIPDNVEGETKNKSTWARQFLWSPNTVLESGWNGFLTLELANFSDRVIWIPAGCPIVQIKFTFLDHKAGKPYKGRYQNQAAGPQVARFLEQGELEFL